MSGDDEILFEVRGQAGIITLNRQKALNAVTLNMVRQMTAHLTAWACDTKVKRVIIQAAPGRAFSAGGDIRAIYDWHRKGDPNLLRFYWEEYRLNRMIKRFPKPYIALIDGIVMGGGVGVSFHGSHRLIGDKALFAMPEVGIGFFPDVGGTYFLPRCSGEVGLYLALTGARIGASDMMWAGLGTHHLPTDSFAGLVDELAIADDLEKVLSEWAMPPHSESQLEDVSDQINEVFCANEMIDIIAVLVGSKTEFARKTAEMLATKSPLSLAVTFAQIRAGQDLDFEAAMALEYRLVSRFVQGPDLYEGIRAVVIDKDGSPQWQPATLGEVTPGQVERYFAPLDQELEFDA